MTVGMGAGSAAILTRSRDAPLTAAAAHAARGWHVFPLRRGSKQPALHGENHCPRTGACRARHHGWEQRATTDPARITACWTHGPGLNIGIACGPSRLVVIDLDKPKPGVAPPSRWAVAGIRDGAGAFAALCRRHGQPWPQTFTVATPSGTHLYFTASTGGTPLHNTAGRLGWCIDTRAVGGYVVGPGSVISGHAYAVVNPADPMPLPAWAAALLTTPAAPTSATPALPACGTTHAARYARAALARESRRVAAAPKGQRNDTLNQAAFALGQLNAAHLLPIALAYTALTQAAHASGLHHDPNCGPRGIDRTIRSGLAAGARKPRTRRL